MQRVEFRGSIMLDGTKSLSSSFGLLGLNALNEGGDLIEQRRRGKR
jgi:hypothetical protein